MSLRLLAVLVITLAFGAVTAMALGDVGYFGILQGQMRGWGPMQVLANLVIPAVLSCIGMLRDAPKHGLRAWPYIVVTLLAGSFGLLFYLIARERKIARPSALG